MCSQCMSSCKYGFLSVDWKRENSATDRLNERYGNSGMEYKGILVDVCHLETQEEMWNGYTKSKILWVEGEPRIKSIHFLAGSKISNLIQ